MLGRNQINQVQCKMRCGTTVAPLRTVKLLANWAEASALSRIAATEPSASVRWGWLWSIVRLEGVLRSSAGRQQVQPQAVNVLAGE